MNAIVTSNLCNLGQPTSGSLSNKGGQLSAMEKTLNDDMSILPARVVFLTHYIPLYQVRVFQAIARRVKEFHILLSTPIEPNRQFELDWGDLNVDVQNTLTMRRRWKHRDSRSGTNFTDPLYVHVPYDTNQRLRKLNPDVVMSLELGARSLGAVRYCRRHNNAKSILCTYMSEHTEVARGWARRKLRKHLVRQADAITYNGPSCKNYLHQLGADADKLYRLSYAADDRTLQCSPVDRADETTRQKVLYVGQLTDRKGVLPMLNQLSDYCSKNSGRHIELRLAGNGPLYDAIEQFDSPPNLKVSLLGNVPPAQLSAEMKECGVTIAPTLADEWLLVVNEALHAGLPVIGSIYAQATETLIRDGQNGWQYDPSQDGSLAQKLDQYFDASAEKIADMRRQCRQSIVHCTPDWAAQGAIEAIADITNARKDGMRSQDQSRNATP